MKQRFNGNCTKEIFAIYIAFFESIDLNNRKSSVAEEYATELRAVELCCQHRTHCFIYNIIGLSKVWLKIHDKTSSFPNFIVKGLFLGLILYGALTSGLANKELAGTSLCKRCMVLIGCLKYKKRWINYHWSFSCFFYIYYSGLHRSMPCIFNAYRARRFVRKHRLLLEQAARHGGVGIALLNKQKSGIPNDCGFGFPVSSIIFTFCLVGLAWWTRQND